MLYKNKRLFMIVDFETTGTDSYIDTPIEIGCIFVNEKLDVLDSYESLIITNDIHNHLLNPSEILWNRSASTAFKIHKITAEEVKEHGKTTREVLNDLADKIEDIKKKYNFNFRSKPVIISDNVQFEYSFLKKLYKELNLKIEDYFHYCGWDTSLFLEFSGVGDPKDNEHRALSDCYGLYKNLVRACEKLGGTFGTNKV